MPKIGWSRIIAAELSQIASRISEDVSIFVNTESSRSASIGIVRKDYIDGKIWLHMAGGESGIGRVE